GSYGSAPRRCRTLWGASRGGRPQWRQRSHGKPTSESVCGREDEVACGDFVERSESIMSRASRPYLRICPTVGVTEVAYLNVSKHLTPTVDATPQSRNRFCPVFPFTLTINDFPF